MSERGIEGAGAGDEARLVNRLRAGDEEAFTTVVRQYSGRLLSTARRFFNEEQDARDAVQDTFLSAFKAVGGFAGQCKLSTWLHRIVVNTALMKIRSRRRRLETCIDDLLPQFEEDGYGMLAADSSHESVEQIVARRQLLGYVRRCIDDLPETYRAVLLLRDVEELDTTEAAALLGISANAVKIRLHRARQTLLTLLQKSHVEWESESVRRRMNEDSSAVA
jgi:RNA polymerase sigma-70 factor (ECF subfamily)